MYVDVTLLPKVLKEILICGIIKLNTSAVVFHARMH